MIELTVEITIHGDEGTLKLKWSTPDRTYLPYQVKLARIKLHTKKLREQLETMVEAGQKGDFAEYGKITQSLAREGYNLYDALFFGDGATDRINAGVVKDCVENDLIAGRDRIIFSVGPKVHIPWGLIYDQNVLNPLDNEEPDSTRFRHFWCVKFSAVTLYSKMALLGIDNVWMKKDFKLLFGAHQDIWNDAFVLIDEEEQKVLHCLLEHPVQPKFSLKDLNNEWRENINISVPHGLLSLYCHADGGALCIGSDEEDVLPTAMFQPHFRRCEASDQIPPTLVFLAGCKTAIGDLDEGFLEATSGPGYCGFIGAEARIYDVFTLRFLTRFLHSFYTSGRSVHEIIQQLRHDHWPLSLVFSVCCPHDLKVKTSCIPLTCGNKIPTETNLSFQRLSSSKGT